MIKLKRINDKLEEMRWKVKDKNINPFLTDEWYKISLADVVRRLMVQVVTLECEIEDLKEAKHE